MATRLPPRNGGNGPEDLPALRAENLRLRAENQRLSAQVLQLEGRISKLEQQVAQAAVGLTLEQVSAALIATIGNVDRILGAEGAEARYTLANLDCDLKGSVSLAGTSLALRPADASVVQSPQALSTVHFSVARVPADMAASGGG